MIWKPTYDVIVSDCALKSFVFTKYARTGEWKLRLNTPVQ